MSMTITYYSSKTKTYSVLQKVVESLKYFKEM